MSPSDLDLPVLRDDRCRALMLERLQERWPVSPTTGAAIERSLGVVSDAASEPTQIFVAVHHGNFPNLEYLAAGLRTRGVKTVAFYLLTPPPPGTFDFSVCLDGSLGALFDLFRRLPAASIYLQAHGRWSFLSQLIGAANSEHAVVQELWDWMDAFVPEQHEDAFEREGVFSAPEITAMRISEQFVKNSCAGFTFKDGGPTLAGIRNGAFVPSHRFLPCPPAAWMRRRTARGRQGAWKVAHAGQLKNANTSRAVFGDLHYLPMIRRLCSQGIEVTAFASATPPERSEAIVFADYVAEAQRTPRFTFRSRLEVDSLIDELAVGQDFGLLLYDFGPELCVGRDHLRSAIASKMFAYVAAGLPVLVSPELETMANFVREHGIGIVVASNETDTLAERLDLADYPRMLGCVAAAQAKFCMEQEQAGLLDFIAERGVLAA